MTQPDVPLSIAPAKPRVLWVDYAKGLSIFLVVAYHVMNGLAKRPDTFNVPDAWDALVNPIFEMVRMPLFFFVSGMFVGRSAQKDAKTYITDKLCAIAWPYLIWSTMQTLIATLLAHGNRTQFTTPLRDLPYALAARPVDQFWFLYVLFLALMLYFVLVKLRLRPWMILGVGVALLMVKLNVDFRPLTVRISHYRVGPAFWPPFFQLLNFFIYMALGAVMAPTLLKNVDRLRSATLIATAIVSAVIVVAAMQWVSLHVTGANLSPRWPIIRRDSYAGVGAWNVPVGIVFALLSVACALSSAVLLQRGGFATFVKTMGQYSLYIFVLHVIFAAGMRTLLLKLHQTNIWQHIVLGCAAGVLLSIGVGVVAKRTKTTWLFTLKS